MDNPEGSPLRTERYRSTVLVVDDEPVNRMVLEGVLPDHVRVITADSGISALKAAAGEPRPDVILLDVMMPDISGLEVLRYIRREPELASIPVIILSAKSMPGDIKTGIEAGASMYLTKPVGFQDLKQAVEQVLHIAPRE